MRVNDNFVLRTVAGEAILINEGAGGVDMNNLLSLNEAAAWLWSRVVDSGSDFDEGMLERWLLEEYDVDTETARRDVAEMVSLWRKYKLVSG